MSDVLENLKKDEINSGLQKHLQKVIRANKRIIFNGDGYTEEWLKEAEKRGLPNAKTTMEALRCLTAPENIAMLEKYGVYNRRELESRFEVFLEEYHRRIRIEGEIALEIAASMIAPVVTAEYGKAAGRSPPRRRRTHNRACRAAEERRRPRRRTRRTQREA